MTGDLPIYDSVSVYAGGSVPLRVGDEVVGHLSNVRAVAGKILADANIKRETVVVVLGARRAVALDELLPDWREISAGSGGVGRLQEAVFERLLARDGPVPVDPRVLDLVGNPRRRPGRRDSRCATCGEKYRVGAGKCARCGTCRDGTTNPKGKGGAQAAGGKTK